MSFHDLIDDHDVPMMPVSERAKLADFLRERPGTIVLMASVPETYKKTAVNWAARIRQGVAPMKGFAPAGHFEAVVRTVFGQTRLYVRYVGAVGQTGVPVSEPLMGLAAALECIRLVQAWHGHALFFEERAYQPDPKRLRYFTESRNACVRECLKLPDADPQTIDRIGREYRDRFDRLITPGHPDQGPP